jgi:RNA polymerase sigma-70 factor (ECF subfamily)
MTLPNEFESIVNLYYSSLYRFAYSLAETGEMAADLTQQTFLLWATKGHQLRDRTKIKTWLFTTLYREFLNFRRKTIRFPHQELDAACAELPAPPTTSYSSLDTEFVMQQLQELDLCFREPLSLFYLENLSYREIADILEIPVGTVMSRLSRGKALLKTKLQSREGAAP